jgi:succinyl-diaminopimelate desuccinylase
MTAAASDTPEGHDEPDRLAAVRASAQEDLPSVIELTQQLVRIPTRGGLDPYDDAIALVISWANAHGLDARALTGEAGEALGVVVDVGGAHPGPRYVLDACLDTAPFGDITAWSHAPTSGLIENGWLHGRGAADSKVAIAIFLHVAARLRTQTENLHGTLTLLFDADEHTGNFGGAKRYFTGPGAPQDVAGVMIGYPGNDRIVVGGRGFLRADLTIRGNAAHTGSERLGANNAIEKTAQLVASFAEHRVPADIDPRLGLPPKLTATKITGGESYSIVPDECVLGIDVRLTTTFTREFAEKLVADLASRIDAAWPTTPSSSFTLRESWPAYVLDSNAPIKVALEHAATNSFGRRVPTEVAGPSNIGNLLAMLGLSATAGLGVTYEGLHGTDERIEIVTIPPAQSAYHAAILDLLRAEPDSGRQRDR